MVSLTRRATTPFRYLRRLPRGDDRTVGAGYAMALAATVATTLYVLVQGFGTLLLPIPLGGGSPVPFPGVALLAFLVGAVSVAGVVAPVAFLAGLVVWRLLPASVPFSGALGGLAATTLVYLTVGVGSVCGAAVYTVLTGGAVATTVVSAVLIVGFAFVFTCWLTLPVGVLAGALYERSRTPDG
jgi:hypothetical protein